MLRRTWAEIDLDCIEHNYYQLRKNLPAGCRFLGVVKADAYGHGAVMVSKLLGELGAEYLAVSNMEEGMQLRRGGVDVPILILGYTPPAYAEGLADYRLTQEVNSLEYAELLSKQLAKSDKQIKIHIKVDTGMTRLGFTATKEGNVDEIIAACGQPWLMPEGIFMHFAVADELYKDESREYTIMQLRRFNDVIDALKARGVIFEICHCANSPATIAWPEAHKDMVRPGLATYGLYPDPCLREYIDLRPAMSLKSAVFQLKDIEDGVTISYGRTYTAQGQRRLAVLPIGYADGLPRRFSGQLEVLIHGKRAPQVGRICMDMCMVDVTDIPDVQLGDIATLIGRDGDDCITLDDWAERLPTITYELACGISKRVPRVFLRGGKEIGILNYII